MKKLIIAVLFTVIVTAAMSHAQTCTRRVEVSAGFSYCPPAGWIPDQTPNEPFLEYRSPAPGPAMNINFKSEITTLSHGDYMMAAIRYIFAMDAPKLTARKLTAWNAFKTSTGVTGSHVVWESKYDGVDIRSVQYSFDLPDRKLLLTGTATPDNKAADAIFDAVAKSFAKTR